MSIDDEGDLGSRLNAADRSYVGIARFEDWIPEAHDFESWQGALELLEHRRSEASEKQLAASMDERLRAAAVDTGAIEGLYDTDRGFTQSIAQHTISMDQAEVEKGLDFRRNFEAQLEAFELALDFATRRAPLSESAIRQMHATTCAGQGIYRVITPTGVLERELALGAYKDQPNHVQLGDGSFHPYCPVDEVPHEVRRLVEETRTDAFNSANAVLQAAYVHHAFTSIHPFSDGNGRVARLLASVWLLRAASVPLAIEPEDRLSYFDALEAADAGSTDEFVSFVEQTAVSLMREIATTLLIVPAIDDLVYADGVREGADSAMSRFFEMLQQRDLTVMRWEGVRTNAPEFPEELEWSAHHLAAVVDQRDGYYRWIAVGIDWEAAPSLRFRLRSMVESIDLPRYTIDEEFAEADFVPDLRSSAERRLSRLADLTATQAQVR